MQANFFAARFFLEAVGAKWGRQQTELPLESKLKRLGGKNKLVKENVAASNELINFRERMINLNLNLNIIMSAKSWNDITPTLKS